MRMSAYVLVSVALLGLTACGQEPVKPSVPPSPPEKVAPKVLPALETANAAQFVPEGSSLVPLEFGTEGTTSSTGTVKGYAALFMPWLWHRVRP